MKEFILFFDNCFYFFSTAGHCSDFIRNNKISGPVWAKFQQIETTYSYSKSKLIVCSTEWSEKFPEIKYHRQTNG